MKQATAQDVIKVRKIARSIAKKHGARVSVITGTGSLRGMVNLQGNGTHSCRIELGAALIAAGYVDAHAYITGGLECYADNPSQCKPLDVLLRPAA
jgi:hypothetical protein